MGTTVTSASHCHHIQCSHTTQRVWPPLTSTQIHKDPEIFVHMPLLATSHPEPCGEGDWATGFQPNCVNTVPHNLILDPPLSHCFLIGEVGPQQAQSCNLSQSSFIQPSLLLVIYQPLPEPLLLRVTLALPSHHGSAFKNFHP